MIIAGRFDKPVSPAPGKGPQKPGIRPLKRQLLGPDAAAINALLTRSYDLLTMALYLVSYLRFVVFSVTALGLTACARMSLPDQSRLGSEARFGDPSASGQMWRPSAVETEAQRVEALHAQVVALDFEIRNLRSALALMGPLPEQTEFLIPAAFTDTEIGAETAPTPDFQPVARRAELYAPAPDMDDGRSLFYQAELGDFGSRALAEAGWRRMAAQARLPGLQPRFIDAASGVRLTVGPLASKAAVDALCIELSAVAGVCRSLPPIRAHR
jgi:hypothetical protein